MSGIVALAGPGSVEARPALADAAETLRHRGVDLVGAEGHESSLVAYVRPGGWASSPEHGYSLALDGKILNGADLRRDLAGDWRFRTDDDAETALAALLAWGPTCANRFRGPFAFVALENDSGRVVAVRDRTGMKPLYFAQRDGLVAIASEIKALHALRLAAKEPEPRHFNEFLIFGYVAGEETLHRGIRELQPGCVLDATRGAARTTRYGAPWDGIDVVLDADDEEHAVDALDETLAGTVATWARDAAGAASLMSGGLDSPFMSWLGARLIPGLTTVSAVFPLSPEIDESAQIDRVAPHIGGGGHLSIELDDAWVEDDIAAFLEPFDDPTLDCNYVTLEALCAAIRERSSVEAVWCGEGSDEMFGGYARHRSVTDEFVATGDPTVVVYARNVVALPRLRLFTDDVSIANTFRHDLFDEVRTSVAGHDPLNAFLMLDQLTFLPAYNHRQDRVAMRHGLEIRMPYQDPALAHFANGLGEPLKHRGEWRKWVLRRVAERHMPHDAVWRSAKQMFALPIAHLFEGRLGEIYRSTLHPGCAISAWYDIDGVHRLLADHRAGEEARDHSNTLWRLLGLEWWLQAMKTPA